MIPDLNPWVTLTWGVCVCLLKNDDSNDNINRMTSITLHSHWACSHNSVCRLHGRSSQDNVSSPADTIRCTIISNYSTLYSPPGSCRVDGSCGSAAADSRLWPAAERPPAPAGWLAPRGRTRCPSLRRCCCCCPAKHTHLPAATQEAWRHISARSPKTL